jgi:hypothetical protein
VDWRSVETRKNVGSLRSMLVKMRKGCAIETTKKLETQTWKVKIVRSMFHLFPDQDLVEKKIFKLRNEPKLLVTKH